VELIGNQRRNGLSIDRMCRVAGISRPAFYRWRERRFEGDMILREAMHKIALEFPWYGYRPMTRALRRELHIELNEKRVRRLMRLDGLVAARKTLRRWLSPKHGFPRYPNLTAGLVPTRLNELWVADLTYVRLRSIFVFVAVVVDALSRRCVGWSLMTHLQAELVIDALRMALRNRRPAPGLIHHSDQGVQYACREYVELLAENGIRPSMSRAGTPYDNAKCERFIKTLKYEEVYVKEYDSVSDARRSIGHFIEIVYNRKRLHSKLGYVPPAEFEEGLEEPTLSLKPSLTECLA
jgi:transposase InsO family protein